MAISHCYWHLVVKNGNFTLLLMSSVKNGNFTLLLTSSGQEYAQSRSTPKCIMGYILWDVFGSHFWFLQEKVGISFYFWIIRIVNSQLALYSHVRLNPPWHPLNTPKMTITNFNYEGSYLPGVLCNIAVKANLGRSPGRSTPSAAI